MKKLYEFEVFKEEEVVEKTTSINDEGNTVIVEKKVKKAVPTKFFIRQPTRSLYEDADLFYGVKLSEGIKSGLLVRSQMNKRFIDDGGILADKTKNAESEAYKSLYEAQEELKKIEVEPESDENKTKTTELKAKIEVIRSNLVNFEVNKESVYDHTAETRARMKTITWWVLQLSYRAEKEAPIFGDGAYDQKITKYDEITENDDFIGKNVISKFMYLISFWYVGRAKSKEDFDKALVDMDKNV